MCSILRIWWREGAEELGDQVLTGWTVGKVTNSLALGETWEEM